MASSRSVAVIDVDGVLADVRHRLHHLEVRPKDWDSFFADATSDPVLVEGLEVALDLGKRYDIVYLTGRPERCREDTLRWLERFDFPSGRLIMRRDTDRRPARLTKVQELHRLQQQSPVALLVDDDERVVEAALGAGFVVRHATWMGAPKHSQSTLFEAQEREGRT
ncbi:MAG TPA: hypothetical protein VMT27_05745 [Actinomycetes bacterium]|nr:hypothetical protein [Actinomycetes bacterium]